jgi:hypothetical protein
LIKNKLNYQIENPFSQKIKINNSEEYNSNENSELSRNSLNINLENYQNNIKDGFTTNNSNLFQEYFYNYSNKNSFDNIQSGSLLGKKRISNETNLINKCKMEKEKSYSFLKK